ncbi:methyltransferase family protein [Kiloniella majae]|uniref:methyltransferase family protein n=1 Tax=Kiloniella majae TaxID=1938558 RepID=UPI0015C5006C|nr:isoprenylcysteine carboxylmethyltransferase family protein [Kiloniella majae]
MQRLLPPFFFLICIVLMGLLGTYYPVIRFLQYPWTLIGLLDLIGGLSITVIAGAQFMRAKTNLKTFNKPDQFVTSGLFKFSRNPMYLGFAISTFGIALYLGALSPFLICVLFILVADRWYIAHEEVVMAETFGEAYMDYKAKVRRWI